MQTNRSKGILGFVNKRERARAQPPMVHETESRNREVMEGSAYDRVILKMRVSGLRKLVLTWSGFSTVNWGLSDDKFEFVFPSGEVVSVHPVLAEFLSPMISRLRRSDPCVLSYSFEKSEEGFYATFNEFVQSVQHGEAFALNQSNLAHLFRFSDELENSDLRAALIELLDLQNLTVEKALPFVAVGKCCPAISSQFEALVDFVASHFYEISNEEMELLDFDTLTLLLSRPCLRIESENSLYDHIRSRMKQDLLYTGLLEYVCVEYLSNDRVQDLAEFIGEHFLPHFSAKLWTSITQRLGAAPTTNRPADGRFLETTILFDSSKPLDGIIAHLTRVHGGNVHDKEVVTVTASSIYNMAACYHPKHAASLETDSIFYSANAQNSWICYDFRNRSIIPTHYTIRSHPDGGRGLAGWHNLRSWVIEGSNDETTWVVLDSRENNSELDGQNAMDNFTIAPDRVGESYRYVRLRQTGPDSCSMGTYYCIVIASLEFFGQLRHDKPATPSVFSTEHGL